MKNSLIFLTIIFMIATSLVSFSLFNYNFDKDPGHDGNEIIVNVDGVTKTLQDAIIFGDLKSSSNTHPSSLLSTGMHYGNQTLVKINGVEKNLQQAINDGLYLCLKSNNLVWSGTFNGDIDPGHTADKIWISVNSQEMSLQTAISRNIFCTTPPSWKFDGWSTCSVTCGGGIKLRNVWCERNDGVIVNAVNCVNTIPISSASCNTQACPVNCVGSWIDNNVCSATCGGGVKQQVYTISVPAQNGGSACSYSNGATRWGSSSCNTQGCPVNCVGSWIDNNVCSATCGGGVKQQVYTISTPASNGGLVCSYSNGATRWGSSSCNTQGCPVNCAGYWNLNVGTCSATCGPGNYDKQWVITTAPLNGGTACPSPTFIDNGGNSCNLGDCLTCTPAAYLVATFTNSVKSVAESQCNTARNADIYCQKGFCSACSSSQYCDQYGCSAATAKYTRCPEYTPAPTPQTCDQYGCY